MVFAAASGRADAVDDEPRPGEALPIADRDLGLLRFQERVFEEAQDPRTPLLERVKFLAIVGTNVDDFLMVRAPGLVRRPAKRFLVEAIVRQLLARAYVYWCRRLRPALSEAGIHLVDLDRLTPDQRAEVEHYLSRFVQPLLKPAEWDGTPPFPPVSTFGTNLLSIVAAGTGALRLVVTPIPEGVSPLVPFSWRTGRPARAGEPDVERGYVWLEQAMRAMLERMPGVTGVHAFRVLREAGLDLDGVEGRRPADRVIEAARRLAGRPVALLIAERTIPQGVLDRIAEGLGAVPSIVHVTAAVFELRRLWEVTRIARPDLREPEFDPANPVPPGHRADLFQAIRAGDVLLHHPFESFQPVVDLLRRAAEDPDVHGLAITLYRTDRESPVAHALMEAAKRGKQVRVVVELGARFDEERNARWALQLEDAGAQVFHAPAGLKVHAKIAVISRREAAGLRHYVHVSSGNYNAFTARVYTDVGLLTCDEDIAADALGLFGVLTGSPDLVTLRKLLVAPVALRAAFRTLLEREISGARPGDRRHIVLKMNALVDPEVVRLLYRASQCGVTVDLIVRGPCCLRPGVPGLSDRVRVRSIVGRFLEHSRIWYFHQGGTPAVYIGSADLMPRNLDRRIEVMAPVTDPTLVRRVRDDILGRYLADNVKARHLCADGSYVRAPRRPGEPALDCQLALLSPSKDRHADTHVA
jgi:polyphosphate kinase